MRGLSIRRKLLLACIAIALLTGATGGGALWAMLAVSRTYKTLAHESLPAVTYLLEADRDMQRVAVAERSLIFMKNDSPAALEQRSRHSLGLANAKSKVQNTLRRYYRTSNPLVRCSSETMDLLRWREPGGDSDQRLLI